jgi:hypothetical protein
VGFPASRPLLRSHVRAMPEAVGRWLLAMI